jgi:hypothetical protein
MVNRLFNKTIETSGKPPIVFLALGLILMASPARSETTIYGWQDESGAISYSDDPTNVPSNAERKTLSQIVEQEAISEPVSEPGPTEIVAPSSPEPLPRTVTEGELAVRLVEELGLADDPTETEAIDLLTSARISPKLGQWDLDQPVESELTVRLRRLTVAAAEQGRITLSPEQSLLAFDTASALLGLDIPVAPLPEETTSATAYPIAETPSLVYVNAPPPDIYPYYVWTPVAGGLWWNGFVLPGFFVLNVNVFVSDHHHHLPAKDRGGFDPGRIGRQFRSRVAEHPNREYRPVPDRERVARSAFHPGPVPSTDRVTTLPKSRDIDPNRPGLNRSGEAMDRHHDSSPVPATGSPDGRRSLSRSDKTMPESIRKAKSDRSIASGPPPADIRPSARSIEPMPRVRPSRSQATGPMLEADRRTPPFGGQPLPRPSSPMPSVKSAPSQNPPARSVSAAVPVPRPPSPPMDQRFMARPQPGGVDPPGRGSAGR